MKSLFLSRIRVAGLAALLAGSASWHTNALRADVVFAWNEALQQGMAVGGSLRPHLEARAYALVHLAMDEAIAGVADLRAVPEECTAAQRMAAAVAARDV